MSLSKIDENEKFGETEKIISETLKEDIGSPFEVLSTVYV